MHIFPEVTGAMISWKACKALGILPECYPIPQPPALMSAFPTVFDGQIRVKQGEELHIAIAEIAKPFCVHTPHTIPFAYRGKLRVELDLLESQNIITLVTDATTWCAPIAVTPKKNSDKIRMCVDLSHLNHFFNS